MRIKPGNSPFEILGVATDCTDEDVRKAYRRLAMKYHPDRNRSPFAEDEFKRIQSSYQMLKTESSRLQVRDIVNIYTPHAYSGGEPAPDADAEEAANFRRAAAAYRQQERRRAFWMEVRLSIQMAMRIERMPLKMFVFVPLLLVAYNWLHPVGIHPVTVFRSLWQGAIAALATDMLLEMARESNRYFLRARINNLVLIAMLTAAAIASFTSYNHNLYGADPEYLYAIAMMLTAVAFYAWIVFCFLFQKHDPFWESLMIWLGVGSVVYTFQFVL